MKLRPFLIALMSNARTWLLVSACAAGTAHAQATARVATEVDPACATDYANAADLHALLEQTAPQALTEDDATFTLRITTLPDGRRRAQLDLTERDQTATRTIEAATCAEVIEAAYLLSTIALAPSIERHAPAAPTPAAQTHPPATDAESPSAANAPHPVTPAQTPPLPWGLRASAGAELATLPSTTGVFAIGAFIQPFQYARFAVDVGTHVPVTSSISVRDGATQRSHAIVHTTARACLEGTWTSHISLQGCGGLRYLLLQSSTSGLDVDAQRTSHVVSGLATIALGWRMGPVSLQIGVDALLHLLRPAFVILVAGQPQNISSVPQAGLSAYLAAEVSLQ